MFLKKGDLPQKLDMHTLRYSFKTWLPLLDMRQDYTGRATRNQIPGLTSTDSVSLQ